MYLPPRHLPEVPTNVNTRSGVLHAERHSVRQLFKFSSDRAQPMTVYLHLELALSASEGWTNPAVRGFLGLMNASFSSTPPFVLDPNYVDCTCAFQCKSSHFLLQTVV